MNCFWNSSKTATGVGSYLSRSCTSRVRYIVLSLVHWMSNQSRNTYERTTSCERWSQDKHKTFMKQSYIQAFMKQKHENLCIVVAQLDYLLDKWHLWTSDISGQMTSLGKWHLWTNDISGQMTSLASAALNISSDYLRAKRLASIQSHFTNYTQLCYSNAWAWF